MSQVRSLSSLSSLPGGIARHQRLEPKIDCTMLSGGSQISDHERQPLDLPLGRVLRLVGVGVTDKNARPIGFDLPRRSPAPPLLVEGIEPCGL